MPEKQFVFSTGEDVVNASAIRDKVYDWFERRYPGGPQWTSRSFHCFRDAPIELRMFITMDKVEAEITNGGLPQLLWNVFFHWRHVLSDSGAGYDLIGATEQREAILEFKGLFERYETECRDFIDRCVQEQSFDYFNKWCEYGYTVMDSQSENLFYENPELDRKRSDWITKNEELLFRRMAGRKISR